MTAEDPRLRELTEQVDRLTEAVSFLLFAFDQLPIALHPYEKSGIRQHMEIFDAAWMAKAVKR